MANKKQYTYHNDIANCIKMGSSCGRTHAEIREKLIRFGFKNIANIKTLVQIYKKEFKYLDDAIDQIAAKVVQQALNGDKGSQCFVLKCKGGWREKATQEIAFETPPEIKLQFIIDKSVDRNRI